MDRNNLKPSKMRYLKAFSYSSRSSARVTSVRSSIGGVDNCLKCVNDDQKNTIFFPGQRPNLMGGVRGEFGKRPDFLTFLNFPFKLTY